MDILGQSALLVAVTSFALGCSVLTRNVRNKLYLSFWVLTTLVALWAFAFFLEKMWPGGSFYRWHLLFNLWIAPAALAFIRLMVRAQDRTSRRFLDFALAGALGLSVALVARLDLRLPFGWAWEIRGLVYFLPAVIIVQIVQLMWLDRTRPRGLRRRRLIYLGGLLVLSTSVMDHVPWIGAAAPILGNLALTAYLFFLSQAITHQRLLNFGALLSRFFVLLVVALTLTGVYSLLFAFIQRSFGLFFLNSFIVSFLLLMMLEPIRSMVGYLTERLLTQKHLKLRQTLREAQRRLTGILEPSGLFQDVLLTSQQTLAPEWMALFVLSGEGAKYRRIRTAGTEPDGEGVALIELLADHPLLKHCEALDRKGELPVLLDQMLESELDRSASRLQRQSLAALVEGLKALRSNLLIPLLDTEESGRERRTARVLGFVTLLVPEPPEPWGTNWGLLSVIYPYFEHAARTMHNMEIYARLREKERLAALGEMAAGLAHEIRNPLGAIKGAAQFLDPTTDRPESRFLGVIVEEVDRLNRVVTQFLDYSKPHVVDPKPVDLSSLVGRSVEAMKPGMPSSVSLEFSPSGKAVHVLASAEQLRQVLINFVQNSVKALEGREGGRIMVSVFSQGSPSGSYKGGDAVIQVEDNGRGIRRENLEKLFIPFFTTSPSGTGLGLPISQKIVEAHRGRIEVTTEEGRFARFSVVLPIAPVAGE